MIVWLNGTFGAGKTTTAAALRLLLPGSRVFDPETVGSMLGCNLADHPVRDFQDWPPWRALVAATATELIRYTGQHLIAPQTVLTRRYMDDITAVLHGEGLEVFHVVLDADEAALRHRIESSGEATQWRLEHLAEYREARVWMLRAADLVVDTNDLTPADVARRVAHALRELAGNPS